MGSAADTTGPWSWPHAAGAPTQLPAVAAALPRGRPMVSDAPEMSVVVPVYGCVDCLAVLYSRLRVVLDEHVSDWELVMVDDHSPDGAWGQIEALASADPRVRAIQLSRNFGQHAAITAGLAWARGDWAVVMDCDLQDPPEAIPRLIAAAAEGYDVVLTKRDQRQQVLFRRLAARTYFRIRDALIGTKVDPEFSTLSLISRKVVDAFLSMHDRDRQYILILHWLGFRHAVIPLTHAERYEGRSSYTLATLMRVAIDGLFFQTTVVLRWVVYVGFAVATAGLLLAAGFVAMYFVGSPLPGFTSLAVLILLVGGFIIVSTGITGLYVGKIFEQVKGRPLYVIARSTDNAHDLRGISESEKPGSPPAPRP